MIEDLNSKKTVHQSYNGLAKSKRRPEPTPKPIGNANDRFLITLDKALSLTPGTPAFRAALSASLEARKATWIGHVYSALHRK